MNTITILECSECAGSVQISNKMDDERYQITHCPYCGLEDIEIDIIECLEEE